MVALGGAALGAVLALVGGVLVRRRETVRGLRAEAYREYLLPALHVWRDAHGRAVFGNDPWTPEGRDLTSRVVATALAVGKRDYGIVGTAMTGVHGLDQHREAAIEGWLDGSLADLFIDEAAMVQAIIEPLERYEEHLRKKLL